MGEVTAIARSARALERRGAVAQLLSGRTDDMLIVTGLGSPTYDVFAAGDHPGNFYLWGAMGGAVMTGMGLALAQPDKPVTVITGDGELLMGLGGLATVAVSRPPNLSIIVLDNGHYGETGGQLSHAGAGVDLASVATAIGLEATTVDDEEGLLPVSRAIGTIGDNPRLFLVRIAHEDTPRALPSRDGALLKLRMRSHLGISD